MYRRVILGGTFDHIHAGHRALLQKALANGKEVLIGLTTDGFVKRRKKYAVKPYSLRIKQLKSYLARNLQRVRIFPLRNQFGPAIKLKRLDAIVVSRETEPTAVKINEMRKQSGLQPLKIISIPMKRDEQGVISCSRNYGHRKCGHHNA